MNFLLFETYCVKISDTLSTSNIFQLNSYAKEPLKTCGGSLLGGDSKRIGDSMCGEAAGILAMRGIDTGVDWVQVCNGVTPKLIMGTSI